MSACCIRDALYVCLPCHAFNSFGEMSVSSGFELENSRYVRPVVSRPNRSSKRANGTLQAMYNAIIRIEETIREVK